MPPKEHIPLTRPFTDLVEKLSNASGVSGAEGSVRAIVKEQLDALKLIYRVDALGNVLVEHSCGKPGALRIMLASHMDEVGLMIVEEDEGGLYRIEIVGGIDPRVLPGKTVWVGKQRLPGIIGARPIHLTEDDERKNPISIDSLRIDLGPGGAGKAKPGDRAVFATEFHSNGFSYSGKALDDRLGVAILLTILAEPQKDIDLLAAFTTQEEIGLRGARVAAYALNPDAAFAIDATPANDLPAWNDDENTGYNTRLGYGPAVYIADGSTLSDPRLVKLLRQTAQKENIPYQIRQPGGGGTDAGSIHKQREGIPSISLSVPIRYAHTPCSIAWQSDIANTLYLIQTVLRKFPADLFSSSR
jgi:putative aminopeptidase FrvX